MPLYFENMVSEDTAVFVKEHLKNCSDCAVEFEHLKSGKQIDKAEISQKENDVNVIMAVKKKITIRIFKIVAAVCFVFIVLFSTIMLYTSISYSVSLPDSKRAGGVICLSGKKSVRRYKCIEFYIHISYNKMLEAPCMIKV